MAERRFKIRAALAATAATLALAIPTALAQADATEPASNASPAPSVVRGDSLDAPAATPLAPVEHGETIVPPATNTPPNSNGGLSAGSESGETEKEGKGATGSAERVGKRASFKAGS